MDENHPSDRCIRIFSDRSGTCVVCGGKIDEDEQVIYDRIDGSMSHFMCPELVKAIDELEQRAIAYQERQLRNRRRSA